MLRGNSQEKLNESQGDYQDRVYSDQTVLMIVRQGGWSVCEVVKGKPRGTTRVKSTQIRWFSGSQAGEDGLCAQQPKDTQRSAKLKGDYQA